MCISHSKFINVNGRLPVQLIEIYADTMYRKTSMFQCLMDGCSHSYSRKDNRDRHMKTVHGIEAAAGRFTCHVATCRMAFFHAANLKQHYKKHGIHISK